MIQTENLTFRYSKKGPLFSFPNINLNTIDNALVLGKSGIGKTTLLHLMAGLLKPITGTVTIDQVELHGLPHNDLDIFRGQNIGLVFQNKHAIASLTVLENIQIRLLFSKKHKNKSSIDSLLDDLGLLELKKHKTSELSQGQLQRLGIALAVIHNPQVILADEPTSSLDDQNCKIVIELLVAQARNTNANLIVITHDHRIKSYFQNSIVL